MNAPGEPTRPKISVVITAFRRQQYIADAVESVLSSDADPRDFEVLLVIDSLAPDLEQKLVDRGVRVLRSDTPFIGESMATGVEAARGEIIAFLDDDDCFHRDKIRILLQELSDPAVLFFHHGFRRVRVDRTAYPVRTEIAPVREEFPIPLSRRATGRIRRLGGYCNASSIAIRRAALLPQLATMRRLTNGPDFSTLLLLAGPGRAVLDGRKVLVDYRTHASMGRQGFEDDELPPQHIRYLEGTVRSFDAMRTAAPTVGAREFADCRMDSYETLVWTTTGRVVSRDGAIRTRALQAIGGNLGERDLLSASVLTTLLVVSSVSRKLARRLYIHLIRVENDGLGIPRNGSRPKVVTVTGGSYPATVNQR